MLPSIIPSQQPVPSHLERGRDPSTFPPIIPPQQPAYDTAWMAVIPPRRRPLSSLNDPLHTTALMGVSPLHHSPISFLNDPLHTTALMDVRHPRHSPLSFRPHRHSLSTALLPTSPHPPILPFISLHSPSQAPAIASSASLYPLIHTAVITIHSLTNSLSLPPHISPTNETPLSFLPLPQPLSVPPHFPFLSPSSLPFKSLFFTILPLPLSSSNSTISHPPLSSQLLRLYIHIHFYIRTVPRSSAYTIIYFRDHSPPFNNLHLSPYLPRAPSWSHPTPPINPINFAHLPHE